MRNAVACRSKKATHVAATTNSKRIHWSEIQSAYLYSLSKEHTIDLTLYRPVRVRREVCTGRLSYQGLDSTDRAQRVTADQYFPGTVSSKLA